MAKKNKEYLGDGAYVDFDGFHIVVTASDGVYDTDKIYLDPEAMKKLIEYHTKINNP